MEDRSENMEPVPASINGRTLLTGEYYCKFYQAEFGLNVTILRVPYIYGPDERTGLLYKLIQKCKNRNDAVIPGSAERACSFLHVDDVVDFLKRAADEEYSSATLVVNLSSAATITNTGISELLNKYFPNAIFYFDDGAKLFTSPAEVSTSKKVFDWIDLHDLSTELDKYTDFIVEASTSEQRGLRKIYSKLSGFTGLLKWVELLLGAALTQFLSQLTGTLIQFKYVDFRLLFVVVMASVYGLQFGLWASLLATLSLIYTWYKLGVEWSLLFYNVGNWFPIALYFAIGIIIGYNHDRTETKIDNEEKQTKIIYEKYEFLYGVFNEIRKLKDEFREQVIGYRDSFGKIYTITRELDSLQEQDVYFKALTILEDLMENNNIAIYSLGQNREYARLQVNSTSLNNKLAKSLKLSDYPEALKSIEQAAIFQNTSLLPNYPAYIAPILNNSSPNNVPVVIIVIWSVKFEQYSMYYYNLFKVICGLIQASLVRVAKFLDANYEKMYLPSTRILNPDAFSDVVKTRAEMKKNKIADYQLIMLEKCPSNIQQLGLKVNQVIRTTDIVGMQRDGNCYILLSQANKLAANDVIVRFHKFGLEVKFVDGHKILSN
jgi:UDP-glucose 4-epimerase